MYSSWKLIPDLEAALIRVISVPHTGTRFIEKCLLGAGLVKTDDYWGMGTSCRFISTGR